MAHYVNRLTLITGYLSGGRGGNNFACNASNIQGRRRRVYKTGGRPLREIHFTRIMSIACDTYAISGSTRIRICESDVNRFFASHPPSPNTAHAATPLYSGWVIGDFRRYLIAPGGFLFHFQSWVHSVSPKIAVRARR